MKSTAGIMRPPVRKATESPGASRRAGSFLGAVCVLVLMPAIAAAASKPKPPSGVCVNSANCTPAYPAREPEPEPAGAMKWNPGHYLLPFLSDSWRDKQSTRFGYYDEIGNNPNIEGATIFAAWKDLEPTRGDYADGIAYLRSEIDHLKNLAHPKRLWIRLTPQSYNAEPSKACSTSGSYYPNYVIDMNGCATSDHQTVAALWKREVADAYIALIEALGAALDDEPYLEGITLIRETAMGRNISQGFSWDAYDTQVRRIASAAKQAFGTTNVVMNVNYMESQGRVNDFIEYLASIGVGVGGPDVAPKCIDDDCSRGYAEPQGIWSYNTVNGNSAGGGVTVSKAIPLAFSVESSELGYDSVGQDGGYTAGEIFRFADTYLRATHLFWVRNDSTGTSDQRWSTGILPTIEGSALTHVDCPSTYEACESE